MTKKAMLVVLFLSLVGILVAGAVIRTLDRTGNVAEARGEGRGGGWASEGAAASASSGNEQGGGYGRSDGGQGAYSQGSLSGDQAGTGQAPVDTWLTLDAQVVSVEADALVLSSAGSEILVDGRPWTYLQEQGFAVEAGHSLRLVGFYEGDEFEIGQATNLMTGQSVQVRDENGRPLWAGRGRRG